MATVNYSWTLPTVGASVNTWGTLLNTIIDDIDAKMVSKTATQTLTNKTLTDAIAAGSFLLTSGTGGIGYGTGAGGTATQPTSKSTNVTLNKPSGKITMNAAALGAGSSVSFVLINSTIAATDTVTANIVTSVFGVSYTLKAYGAGGGITFYLKNETGGSLSDAVDIQFNVHKGATA